MLFQRLCLIFGECMHKEIRPGAVHSGGQTIRSWKIKMWPKPQLPSIWFFGWGSVANWVEAMMESPSSSSSSSCMTCTHTQSIQHPTSFANLSFAKPFLSKGMAKTSSLPPPAPSLQVDVASELLMGFGVSEPPLVSSELPGCQPWRVQRGGGGSLREINMWKWQGSFKSHGGGGGKWVATWWEACRKKIGHIPQQLREYYLMGTDFHVISVCFWCLYSRNWLTLMTQWLPLLPLRSSQVCQRAWPWNMCLGNPEDVGRDVKAEPQLGSHPLQKTIVFQVVWRKLR